MSTIEIILLVIGVIVFVVSFILPEKKREFNEDEVRAAEDAVKKSVNQEIEQVRGRIEDVIDETITYSMEKTERTLERLTNEKMMAVNEYSDTVLENIHKNHDEVMFLYDMLNQKHQSLKQLSLNAQELIKEIGEKEKVLKEKKQEEIKEIVETTEEKEKKEVIKPKKAVVKKEPDKNTAKEETASVDIKFAAGAQKGQNSNDRILALYKDGKSKMAIAKELGLGVGEVKLVIDLFEGM